MEVLSHSIKQGEPIKYKIFNKITKQELILTPNEIPNHKALISYWKKIAPAYIKKYNENYKPEVKPQIKQIPLVQDSKKVEIVGIKKQGTTLYICIKDGEEYQLIDSTKARAEFPSQLASYYESKLMFEDDNQ